MNTALITWLSVAILMLVIVFSKVLLSMMHTQSKAAVNVRHYSHHMRHIIELSNESEILFIPGDKLHTNGDDCNADDSI